MAMATAMAMAKLARGRPLWRRALSSTPSEDTSGSVATFLLPSLKYDYNALEPHFDETTMKLHHTRHHQTYVSNLNAVLTGPDGAPIQGLALADIQKTAATLPDSIRSKVINHGGGHYNHSLFFSTLRPEGDGPTSPVDELRLKIDADFGSLDALRTSFDTAALSVFGSGWAWLGLDADGALRTVWTRNQENPLMAGVVDTVLTPILGLDVWEHAMYLKYQNRRPEYIDAFWHLVDWEQVARNYAAAQDGATALIDVPMEE